MSRQKTKDELIEHKKEALSAFENYLDSLIESSDIQLMGKSDKICYWLKDWARFLSYETQFSPTHLRRYKRGEIVKVHLGFNIGSEEGGLHYAVVLDKNNNKSSPVVTIIPLTSLKQHVDVNNLKPGNVFLGNELFTSLNSKVNSTLKHLNDELDNLMQISDEFSKDQNVSSYAELENRITTLSKELELIKRMKKEVQKMKYGSIALIGQITTISKIRIYDPKTDHDILSNIKLSNEKLDAIDSEINQIFIQEKFSVSKDEQILL